MTNLAAYNQISNGLLSKQQAAQMLGISISTLDRHMAAGRISFVRVGLRRVGFRKESILDYISRNETALQTTGTQENARQAA